MTLPSVKSKPLEALSTSGIRHGFYTRQGGLSSGIYDSLNTGLGSKDDPELVMQNRERIAADLGVAATHLAGCYQVHSADVISVNAPMGAERPEADGMATNQRGIALGVLTADCGPILFADESAQVIGACHAGWKGALTGVAENTIEAMIALGAKRGNICAVLGPCIGQNNYEVGPEFKTRFADQDEAFNIYFSASAKPEHYMFDMQTFILDRLKAAGVNASKTGECTYDDEERFFSYRRTTHRNEPDYGRQMSAIALI
ncbi:peptidoglycan editing factor PgeF [Ahrensia sp. 13_GOM-1096m]|uniref:peptidoglycan editing factor PgeF n=1 Tax=Ahrensia sp. 13_GOM-1096m TaxID=1380380 RepID=UPI00047A5588|nr:peptidoglycan editing factor PgeF [Ahrensia sp. 13_GOM-1096m]